MEAARAAAAATAASIVATGSRGGVGAAVDGAAAGGAGGPPAADPQAAAEYAAATEALKAAAAAEPFPRRHRAQARAAETQAGGVIGRGAVVQRIVSQSGAVIKISNSDELLPRTRERVCTITGRSRRCTARSGW